MGSSEPILRIPEERPEHKFRLRTKAGGYEPFPKTRQAFRGACCERS
jgi:hypothetical protein